MAKTGGESSARAIEMVLGVDTHLHTHAAVALDQLGRRLGELAWKRVCDPVPRSKILGAMDLREISARGMEVGAHSMTHVVLSGIEPEVLEREVNHTRYVLSEVLGGKGGRVLLPVTGSWTVRWSKLCAKLGMLTLVA